jgi:hypothetical protein
LTASRSSGALIDDADHAKLSAAVDSGASCWIPATAPNSRETMLFAYPEPIERGPTDHHPVEVLSPERHSPG